MRILHIKSGCAAEFSVGQSRAINPIASIWNSDGEKIIQTNLTHTHTQNGMQLLAIGFTMVVPVAVHMAKKKKIAIQNECIAFDCNAAPFDRIMLLFDLGIVLWAWRLRCYDDVWILVFVRIESEMDGTHRRCHYFIFVHLFIFCHLDICATKL